MEVLIFMLIGIILGLKWFPTKYKKWNERIQVMSISILIFLSGWDQPCYLWKTQCR